MATQPIEPVNQRASRSVRRSRRLARSFTLTELLVVTLLIVVLAGMIVGLAGYIQTRSARSRAQVQMAMIEAACEAFRADIGRYPTSTPGRVVIGTDIAAVDNNHLLFRQLLEGGYISAASFDVKRMAAVDEWIRSDCSSTTWGGWVLTNRYELVLDPWGRPWNYYCVYPLAGQPPRLPIRSRAGQQELRGGYGSGQWSPSSRRVAGFIGRGQFGRRGPLQRAGRR